MSRLRIQHCIISNITRQYGTHPTSDLLGVDYFHTVPAHKEFPYYVSGLELFVRFLGTRRIRGRIRITVSQIDDEGFGDPLDLRSTLFAPTAHSDGVLVLDKGFKLINMMIPEEGTFAVRVHRRIRPHSWSPPEWRVLATEWICLSRSI